MSLDEKKQADVSSDTASSTHHGAAVAQVDADITLKLIEAHGDEVGELTPEAEKKLRRKLYLHIMVLLSAINIILFIDKSTLGYAAVLGLFEETKITKAQYNNLNTFFYVGECTCP
jgi:hypothetical protein